MRWILVVLSLVAAGHGWAESRAWDVTVSTLVPAGSPVTDGLSLGPNGDLFASDALGAGNLSNPQGTTVVRIDSEFVVDTFATGLGIPMDHVFDDSGNLYVAGYGMAIKKILPDGTVTPFVALVGCTGMARDGNGVIYTARPGSLPSQNRVYSITPEGVASVFYSGAPLNGCIGVAVDELDRVYVANWFDGKIHRFDPATPGTYELIATIPGTGQGRTGYLAYRDGGLICPGYHTAQVFHIDVDTGEITVLAGTGVVGHVDGPGETAQFMQPNGIAISASGESLFVSDDLERSLRLLVLSPASTDVAEGVAPADRLVGRITPNPFNAHTTIRYTLPEPAVVSLSIYDTAGRLIRELVQDAAEDAGAHAVDWDGRDRSEAEIASGIYFYRLEAGDRVESGRMALVK